MNPKEIVERAKEIDDRIVALTKQLRRNKYFLTIGIVVLIVQLALLVLLST